MSDVLNRENYSIADASRLLHVAGTTLHRWAQGWTSRGKRQAPMIRPRDGRLSFQDLAELSVVAQLRMNNISVVAIREAAAEIRRGSGVERPFLQGVLVSEDWREFFFEHLGRLISANKRDQSAMPDVVRARMIRPDRLWIREGQAVRVFPYSRDDQNQDPMLVAIDPRFRFGRPVTNPTMIDIDGLVRRIRWGESFEEVADLLQPERGVAELEEGVRYWLSTATRAVHERVESGSPTVVRRVSTFGTGASVDQIAKRDGVRQATVTSSLRKALEQALAA